MGPGGDGCAHCILGVDVWTIKGVLGLASEKTGARAQVQVTDTLWTRTGKGVDCCGG